MLQVAAEMGVHMTPSMLASKLAACVNSSDINVNVAEVTIAEMHEQGVHTDPRCMQQIILYYSRTNHLNKLLRVIRELSSPLPNSVASEILRKLSRSDFDDLFQECVNVFQELGMTIPPSDNAYHTYMQSVGGFNYDQPIEDMDPELLQSAPAWVCPSTSQRTSGIQKLRKNPTLGAKRNVFL